MKERTQPETLRLRKVTPSLTVNDLEASAAWYRDVLGFIETDRYEEEGNLRGIVMRAGSIELMLGQDDFAKGRDRVKGVGFRLYCETVQDIDEIAANVRQRGGKLAQEPTDQSWGVRDLAVVDLDGYKISIARPIRGT